MVVDNATNDEQFLLWAKNLDDLIEAHSTYVEKLYDRCLLSQKVRETDFN